jgi:hypothetical protein
MCTDVGIEAFACACEAGWSGFLCQLSDNRTLEIEYHLAETQDIYEFSRTLEVDLEAEYPSFNITVIPVVIFEGGANSTVFRVTFLVDETDSVVPKQAALEALIDSASYEGTVIFSATNIGGNTNGNAGDEDDNDIVVDSHEGGIDFIMLVTLGIAVLVVVLAGILVWRWKKREVKFVVPS